MSQKATKEQMPALIAELANRTGNVKHMKSLQKFIGLVSIPGTEAIELGMAINWLNNVVAGEDARCAELKAQLPAKDTTINLTEVGPEEPATPEAAVQDPEPPPAPAVGVGAVEMSKGSEVLQPA